MCKHVFIDRRVWLLALILAFVVVMTRWTLTPAQGYGWVIKGGYWVTLSLVALFLSALFPLVRDCWNTSKFGRFEIVVVVTIILTVGVWASHEKMGYKILADEALLSGTAMGLHYQREAAYPHRATDVQGAFQVLASILDKRPLLFPFLVATIHDLTGYRTENPFYLNMALGACFLWLSYLVGWNLGRSRWAGIVILILFAGLPLLAQQATGGGFELLNLVLLAAFLLLMLCYIEKPEEERRLEAFVFGALLLASTRYESAIFLLFAGIAVLAAWCVARRVVLNWRLMLAPIFLVPLLLQNRIFAGQSQAWQMSSSGVTEPFGFQYLSSNLGHALAFFFDFSGYQSNSPLFAALGLLSLPFFGLWIGRILCRPHEKNPAEIAWAMAGLSLFAVTAIYMLYFWGRFDDPIISRLSLPVHLLMAIAIIVLGTRLFRTDVGWKILALSVLLGTVGYSLPVISRQAYRTSYVPGMEYQMRADFVAGLTDRNILFLDNDSFYWILHHISASPVLQIQIRKEGLIYHLRNHSFQAMYVFQSILVDDQTGKRSVDPADDLGPDFELEAVLERRVQTLLFARISRITGIRKDGAVTVRPVAFVEALKEMPTAAKLEEVRGQYLENWIKQLP